MLFFACQIMFSSFFKSFDTLVIIWRTRSNFSSRACKDFYFYKIVLIYLNVALIIAYKRVFSLFMIACIIWTCLAGRKLLNCSPIAQAYFENLTTGAIEVKLCSLRYKNYNSSRLSIRFTIWCHRSLFSLSVAFATNSVIAVAIALLVATIFAGI